MKLTHALSIMFSATAVGLCSSAAFAAPIQDSAHLFSQDAVAAANRTISDLEAKHRHGIRIETHETVPAAKADAVAKMSSSERSQFFANWLKERAQATRSEGLFLLITQRPSHLQVGVSSSLRRAGFTPTQRQALIGKMTSAFKAGDFDRGLHDGLASIEQSFAALATAGAPRTVPAPVGEKPQGQGLSMWTLLLIVGLVVGGLFLLSMLSRAFSGGQAPGGYGGGGYGPGMGGGGWMGSLLAGMGGAFAGNWLYDQISGHRHTAHADEPHHGPGAGAADHDQSWSSAGADWGDNSGGSDFGGGDFGGGDSGGSDW